MWIQPISATPIVLLQNVRAKSAQSHKDKTAYRGENQHKRLVVCLPYDDLLFITKAKFFLFISRFCQNPLAEGGYFTQFCLTVTTNEIKRILLTRTSLNGQTKRPASISDCAITLLASATPVHGLPPAAPLRCG